LRGLISVSLLDLLCPFSEPECLQETAEESGDALNSRRWPWRKDAMESTAYFQHNPPNALKWGQNEVIFSKMSSFLEI
jgi:hypothetical protein